MRFKYVYLCQVQSTLKFRTSKMSIWSCHLLLLDRYCHWSTCFGNPCSTDVVFSVSHGTGCCVVSTPALRLRAPQGNGKFVGRRNLANTQLVSSTCQHFYKLLCPCLSERKCTLWWMKHIISCTVLKIWCLFALKEFHYRCYICEWLIASHIFTFI